MGRGEEGGDMQGQRYNCTSTLRNTVDRARLTFDEIQSGKKAAQNIVCVCVYTGWKRNN